MTLYAFFSQIASESPILFSYGPLGIMCGYLMIRGEKAFARIDALAHRIDGLTRALLMDMVQRDNVGRSTKDYARDAIAKIDARNVDGGPK